MITRQHTIRKEVVNELVLFIINDGETYKHTLCLIDNYRRKVNRGTFNKDKAVKGFVSIVQTGMKEYTRQIYQNNVPWYLLANTSERVEVARELLGYYMDEIVETA